NVHLQITTTLFTYTTLFRSNAKYIVEIKYEVAGKTRTLNKLSEAVPAMSYCKHFVSEFVGKEKDGKTPVSLRFFVDKETYNKMRSEGHTSELKSPCNLLCGL